MPDGVLPTETTAPELAAETADSRMVQHVRRNLVLWSAGTTLVADIHPGVSGSTAYGSSPYMKTTVGSRWIYFSADAEEWERRHAPELVGA